MNLYLSVLLAIGIISCLCLAAPATDDDGKGDGGLSGRGRDVDIHECTGQYLKSKGLLASDVPTGISSPVMCSVLTREVIPSLRKNFENKAKEMLPNEVVCLMIEFDKGEIVDFVFKFGFYKTHQSITAAEKGTHIAIIETEKMMNTIASVCGIEEDKFAKFLRGQYT